jgi:hypothetical protein
MATARPQRTQVIVASVGGCRPYRSRLVASVVVAAASPAVVLQLIAFVVEEFCDSD